MSIFSKLLDAIRVNDDYDEDDDDFLDEDDMDFDDEDDDEGEDFDDDDEDDFDDEEEKKPKHRFFRKMKEKEEIDEEPAPVKAAEPVAKTTKFASKAKEPVAEPVKEKETFTFSKPKPAAPVTPVKASPSSKVTPMRKKGNSLSNMEVVVIKPASMEDTREIADSLHASHTVILNLEGVDVDVAQRIIDFCCGSTYMINGSIQKVSSYIFILTPDGVEISGDYQDILSGAFDLPSMRMDY